MENKVKEFINNYWLEKDGTPSKCLIEGDKSTRINLGYYKLINNNYELTEYGLLSLEKLKINLK